MKIGTKTTKVKSLKIFHYLMDINIDGKFVGTIILDSKKQVSFIEKRLHLDADALTDKMTKYIAEHFPKF
jgi:hypothetical protein